MLRFAVIVVWLITASGCDEEELVPLPAASTDHPAPWNPDNPYEPGVQASDLTPDITHPLFPAPVGATWVYEGQTEDGQERIEVVVEPDLRDVWGTSARVIRDTVSLEGEMIEDTWDWYAQDSQGNVWYLGEETYEYEDGEIVCSCGAWESGLDSALPGIIMLAEPQVGQAYRQEYSAGVAEDLGEIVEVGLDVTVQAGTFTDCVKIRDLNLLERDVEEFKYFCPNVGVVLEEVPEDDERIELIEYDGLSM